MQNLWRCAEFESQRKSQKVQSSIIENIVGDTSTCSCRTSSLHDAGASEANAGQGFERNLTNPWNSFMSEGTLLQGAISSSNRQKRRAAFLQVRLTTTNLFIIKRNIRKGNMASYGKMGDTFRDSHSLPKAVSIDQNRRTGRRIARACSLSIDRGIKSFNVYRQWTHGGET